MDLQMPIKASVKEFHKKGKSAVSEAPGVLDGGLRSRIKTMTGFVPFLSISFTLFLILLISLIRLCKALSCLV